MFDPSRTASREFAISIEDVEGPARVVAVGIVGDVYRQRSITIAPRPPLDRPLAQGRKRCFLCAVETRKMNVMEAAFLTLETLTSSTRNKNPRRPVLEQHRSVCN